MIFGTLCILYFEASPPPRLCLSSVPSHTGNEFTCTWYMTAKVAILFLSLLQNLKPSGHLVALIQTKEGDIFLTVLHTVVVVLINTNEIKFHEKFSLVHPSWFWLDESSVKTTRAAKTPSSQSNFNADWKAASTKSD